MSPFPTSSLILADVLMITDSGSVDTEDVSDELGDTVVTPLHSSLLQFTVWVRTVPRGGILAAFGGHQ